MNVVWLRRDLRLSNNPALFHANQNSAEPLLVVFTHSSEQMTAHAIGHNQQALIESEIQRLAIALKEKNIISVNLSVNFSEAPQKLFEFLINVKCKQLFFNVEYPYDERLRDKQVVTRLQPTITCNRYNADSLIAPWEITNLNGLGYKVYSGFKKRVYERLSQKPLTIYPEIKKRSPLEAQRVLSSLKKNQERVPFNVLFEKSQGVKSSLAIPNVNAKASKKKLEKFCEKSIASYAEHRDYPAVVGTSELSSALAVGTISSAECYEVVSRANKKGSQKWLDEIIWRDFYRSVIWHYPRVSKNLAFNPVDQFLNWHQNSEEIEKFYEAQTGIPIIDAAIKQLIDTGWMHNRLRMVVASYFTKNLWGDWRLGERFFAKHLFDYDFASNNGGWQWCASVGTDAAPYFRIFNPLAQQKKFDPNGEFVRRWITELDGVDNKLLTKENIRLASNYPISTIDLKKTRQDAIDNFKQAKLFLSDLKANA